MRSHWGTLQELGINLLNDVSILLVPVISIWNTLPVAYFVLIEALILKWIAALRATLTQPTRLHFYYHKFLVCSRLPRLISLQQLAVGLNWEDLADAQCCVGDVFGPWILVTLGWTLFSLCLTIYFATKTPPLESMPKSAPLPSCQGCQG